MAKARINDRQMQLAAEVTIEEMRLMDASPITGVLDAIQITWTNVSPDGDYPQLNRDTAGPWDLRIQFNGSFNPYTVQEIARAVMEALGIRLVNWQIKIEATEASAHETVVYFVFAP